MKNLIVAHFPSNLAIPDNVIAITNKKRSGAITWEEIKNLNVDNQPSMEDFEIFNKHKSNLIRVAQRWSIPGECHESLAGASLNLISIFNQWLRSKSVNSSLFFTAMPHRLNDLCLQIVLAEKNISTYFSRKNFEYGTWILRDFTNGDYFFSDNENKDFDINKKKYNDFISLTVPKYEKVIMNQYESKYLIFAVSKIVINFLKRLFFRGSQDVLGPNSNRNNLLKWDLMHLRSLLVIRSRKIFYNSLSLSSKNIEEGSVVFFLSFQPEGNTDPEALEYAEIFNSIAKIKQSFPVKRIYIKEHPASFNYMHYKEVSGSFKFRTKLLYKALNDSNIQLLDINTKLNELPDNTVIATVNGSVFLQANHFGFSAFKTGRSWCDFDMEFNHIKSVLDQEKINKKIHHILRFSYESEEQILNRFIKNY